MIFVSSWDDGSPQDERLAGLLDRFGLAASFFVPGRNREGRPVLSPEALRRLDARFEIGSHTRDHAYLATLPPAEVERQVRDGKQQIEEILGHRVDGFCYPGGKRSRAVRSAVIDAGFAYARTTENLRLDADGDAYALPTTLQFFPHGRPVLLRNYVRHGRYVTRFPALAATLRASDWLDALRRVLDLAARRDGVFHLWGHSWEIDAAGLWLQIESFLAQVAALRPATCTLDELARRRGGGR